jgi:hypothetical protein
MRKIDKTKENIGVDNLEESSKKELFNKFVEAGGEVIKENRKKGFTDFDREKQRKHRQRIDAHREKLQSQKTDKPPKKPERSVTKGIGEVPKRKKPNRVILFFEKFYIRLRLYFTGVTDFSAIYLKSKFLNRFNIEYNPSLMEMQILYMDIFKGNQQRANLILNKLDEIRLLYYELIEKIAGIYDRSTANRIVDEFRSNLDTPQSVLDVKEPTMTIFKKLYILRQYQESLLIGFEKAINFQMNFEKDKPSLYANKKKRARNSLYILFNKLLPALYLLFCHYQGRIIPLGDPVIDKILSIKEEDKPGKRIKATKPKDMSTETDDEKKDTDEAEEKMPENVKKGIELMFQLDLKRLREEYDKQLNFKNAKDNDKVLITYLLFEEFDQEYSFILTTNKIKYRVIFSSSGKLDYKTILSDLYNEQRKCIEAFKAYTNKLMSFEKAKMDKPINNIQYIDYSKKLTSLEKEKKSIGRNTRMIVKAFMDRITDEFYKLIEDMENEQKIIENPQDELVFNTEIEGNRKLNKLKVYEAINRAYYFASAFAYRLDIDGDLSGEIEFTEGEEALSTDTAKAAESSAQKPEKQDSEVPNDKSVIEELDDLL